MFVMLVMFTFALHARIRFENYDANIVIKESASKLILNKADKVTGWSEFSIIKRFGEDGASNWVEQYPDGVTISQEGSQEPATNLVVANSNAINYGIKNNSNAIVFLLEGEFTPEEKAELLEGVRTTSNAFLYCCKNVSNALSYGIKNNSNVIVDFREGAFTVEEKEGLLDNVRTTSNAFLYCCKNTSNALIYGLRTTSNAIMAFPLTICGCCDGCCEPVARALRSPRYAEDGYSGSTGRTPRYAQGATRCERVENTSRRSFSEASWSPDKKFLAVITETEEGQEIHVYRPEMRTVGVCAEYARADGLRLVTHAKANDGARICSVAWSDNGFYLALEREGAHRDVGDDDVFVYTFDAQSERLSPLPNIDVFLKKI